MQGLGICFLPLAEADGVRELLLYGDVRLMSNLLRLTFISAAVMGLLARVSISGSRDKGVLKMPLVGM